MARKYNPQTLAILNYVSQNPEIKAKDLLSDFKTTAAYKDFYNCIYRLIREGFLQKQVSGNGICLRITNEGLRLLGRHNPKRDGVWKIVIFDIPEKQKYVRSVLRAKLKFLHFKKWQNSIWVSPFKLDEEIEKELNDLAKKYFVRLIKTTDINFKEDLEKMFE